MPAEESVRIARSTIALAVLLVLGTACASKTRDAAAPAAAPAAATQPPAAQPGQVPPGAPAAARIPADHAKDKDGVMHKRGYKKPLGDCTSCHGKDLRGQDQAPSCYECHGKEWH
jgi:hypothetical protein